MRPEESPAYAGGTGSLEELADGGRNVSGRAESAAGGDCAPFLLGPWQGQDTLSSKLVLRLNNTGMSLLWVMAVSGGRGCQVGRNIWDIRANFLGQEGCPPGVEGTVTRKTV